MEKENADESSCFMSSKSMTSYNTQSEGILERGGGRRLKVECEGEDEVGVEEIVGTGGGGYLGRLLRFLVVGKAGSS